MLGGLLTVVLMIFNLMMGCICMQGVISIQEQLRQFQTLVDQNRIAKSVVEKSVFFLESGSNDIFNYFLPFDPPTLGPDAYVEGMTKQVANLIDQIYKLGGRRIAVFSLGPVGCIPARALLPAAPLNKCYGKINVMVKKYNKAMERLVNDIPVTHPAAVAVYGAVYDIVQRFRALPTRYGNHLFFFFHFFSEKRKNVLDLIPCPIDSTGFSDVSSACCGDGPLNGQLQCGREGYKICPNPNGFLFWDYFHPTEHTYKLISKALWGGKKAQIRPMNIKNLIDISQKIVGE